MEAGLGGSGSNVFLVLQSRHETLAAAAEIDRSCRGNGPSRKRLRSGDILDAIADHDPIMNARDDVHPVDRPNFGCRNMTVDPVHIIDPIDIAITGDVADPLNGIVPIHGLHAIAAGPLADDLGLARRDRLHWERPGASNILALVDDPVLIANARDHVDACDGLHPGNIHDAACMRYVSGVIDIPIARALRNWSRSFGRIARGRAGARAIAALGFGRH